MSDLTGLQPLPARHCADLNRIPECRLWVRRRVHSLNQATAALRPRAARQRSRSGPNSQSVVDDINEMPLKGSAVRRSSDENARAIADWVGSSVSWAGAINHCDIAHLQRLEVGVVRMAAASGSQKNYQPLSIDSVPPGNP